MTDKRMHKIQELKKHRIRARRIHIALAVFGVFAVIILGVKAVSFFRGLTAAVVELSVQNTEIVQGEAMPPFLAEVKLVRKGGKVLDKESKYTAADFVADLKSGKGYTLSCKGDPNVEGSYQIKVVLEESVAKKIEKDWKRLLNFTVKNGRFVVKNAVGTWEGDKFKKYDNSYVKSDFIESMANTYYLGKDGVKVTGWQKIKGKRYYFDKDGVMLKSQWKKDGDDKYYLGKNGVAATGWKEIKKSTYYFAADGKMATGDVKMGLSLCSFDEDGKLVSKKDAQIDPGQPMVALTFDDGPGKRTGELLDALEKYNAHATFFMLGQKVPSYEAEVKKMKEIGCELGSHSYDHTNLVSLDSKGVKKQMSDTDNNIKKAVGSGVTVMRPPYGAINDTVRKNVGLPMILWNIDTLDWKTRNAKKTINTVMKNVGDGDIILLHDIHTESVDAAIKLVPKLQKAGYQLVTVSEMAAAKGLELEDGGKYTDFTK